MYIGSILDAHIPRELVVATQEFFHTHGAVVMLEQYKNFGHSIHENALGYISVLLSHCICYSLDMVASGNSVYRLHWYTALVLSVLVGTMMSLLLLTFAIMENSLGHSIAIASFAATTVIVFLQNRSIAAQPLTIASSYILAAIVGFLVSYVPMATWLVSGIGISVLVFLLVLVDRMHPPAIAYAFGFIIGGYGILELLITVPALLLYFIALGAVVVVVETAATSVGLLRRPKKQNKTETMREKIEQTVSAVVPYGLVVLFILLVIQYVYPEAVAPYQVYVQFVDWVIICLFVVDLYFAYRRAQSAKLFVKANWLDIIATIPFFVMFRFIQGTASAFTVLARGATEVITDTSQFVRLLRPVARIPRFADLIKRIESLDTPHKI